MEFMEFISYVVGILAVIVVAVLRKRKEPESESYAQGGIVRTDYQLRGIRFMPSECIIRQDMVCARGEDPMHNPDDARHGVHARFWYCARYTGLQPTPEQARSWREDRLREMNRRTET